MKKKDVIRIINEEISGYDFLNISEIENTDNYLNIINSKEFQTQLVYDIISKNPNITDWNEALSSVDDVEDDGWGDNVIPHLEKNYTFTYNHGNQPYKLTLDLEGHNVPISMEGSSIPATHLQPAEYPEPSYADYSDIEITFGDEYLNDSFKTDWLDKNGDLRNKLITSILGHLP